MSNPEFPHPDQPTGGAPWGGFFASIRRQGIVRTNERWVGGVAGGLARRLGVDPVLVRCIWIVLCIFSGVGLLLYGLAWALLPEEDGRIHVEQALIGDVSAGVAGGVFLTIAGLVTLDHGIVPSWYMGAWGAGDGSGLLGALWSALWILLLVSLAYVVVRALISARRNREARREAQAAPGYVAEAGSRVAPGTQPVFGQGAPVYGQGAPGSPADGQGDSWDSQGTTAPQTPPVYGQTRLDDAGAPLSATTDDPSNGGAGAALTGAPAPWDTARPTAAASGPAMAAGAAPSATAPVMTYPGGRPAPAQPPRPRVPGPGRSLSLLVLGAALLAAAGVALALATGRIGPFGAVAVGAGSVVALLGIGVAISGIRGRRGGWMTWIGWLTALGAVPALAITSFMPAPTINAGWDRNLVTITVTEQMLEQAAADAASEGRPTDQPLDLGTYSAAAVTLDLTKLDPTLAEDYRVGVTVGLGTVRIVSREGLPLTVNGEVRAGSLSTETARGWDYSGAESFGGNLEGLGTSSGWPYIERYAVDGTQRNRQLVSANDALVTRATMRSPEAQENRTGITVDATVGGGTLEVTELNGEVTWSGVIYDHYWIVESWTDAEGGSHYDSELPVPGMTHPAISWTQAGTCLDEVVNSTDEDGWSYGDPSALDELSTQARRIFDGCVARTLDEQGVGQEASGAGASGSGVSGTGASGEATPSAAASAEATPATSDEPTGSASATATATGTEAA